MIWAGGRVLEDDALKISARDRTFEHGLGLFETLRTWNGRAPLLDRHLARLTRSAGQLGVPIDPAASPNAEAVAALLDANRVREDVVLRITLTGGFNETEGSTLWMRTGPLPPPIRREGAVVEHGTWKVFQNDPIARHKTLNYWSRRQAYESARALGYDEVLSETQSFHVGEGSRTNLFLVSGDALLTPPLEEPIVPGIMRALVLEQAQWVALTVVSDRVLDWEMVWLADEVFLTNSVRGIIPVARIGVTPWPAPGPRTQRLSILVNDYCQLEETAPWDVQA